MCSSFLVVFSSLFSTSLLAHEAGDFILRTGAITVYPSGDSGIIQPTVVSPNGKVSIDSDTQLGIIGTYMFTSNWAVEVLAATPFTHTVSFAGDLQGLGSIATAKHLPPTVSALYYFNNSSKFSPYLGAGINYTMMLETEATDNGRAVLDSVGTGGDYSIDADDSLGLSFQAGFDYELSNNWILEAAVRYIDIDTTIEVANSLKVNLDIDPWVYMIGIGYRF
ncbi:MAG: outer membrane beta-barrel protein [Proteobacteria bacterium]|nr:outer membrane beta-barrel protein [Pseudomonadota bacterium]